VCGAWAFTGSGEAAYETAPVERGTLEQRVTAVGQLEPLESVDIGSDLTGHVAEVLVDENDVVRTGDVLARLDPGPFENAVVQARAAVSSGNAGIRKAQVDLERAEQEQSRSEGLFERGATSRVARDEARLQVQSSRALLSSAIASRDQARAALEQAQVNLSDTVITSPIDGVVIRRMVDEGQTVVSAMSATSLFEVASDLADLKVEVEVDEADVGVVHAGQSATFTVSAWPELSFEATVMSVDLAADASSSVVVYGTELRVDNQEGLLRPGMTATAELLVGEVPDALLVPTLALRYRPERMEGPDTDHVWTLSGDTITAVEVRIGGTDGATTAVYGDLPNDAVVVIGGGR
jgi:HlyD family secretion protein